MKERLLKVSCTLIAVAAFAIMFCLTGTTAKAASDVWQSTQTDTSITVNWNAASINNVTAYYIGWGVDYDSAKNMRDSKVHTVSASTRSYTITGLAPGTKYNVCIGYSLRYRSGSTGSGILFTQQIKTLPGVVTGLNQKDWYRAILSVDIEWDRQTGADGYIFKFMKEDGTVIETQDGNSTSFSHSIDNKRIYKGTCQAYSVINGVKYYGPVSPTAYFMTQPAKKNVRELGGKVKGGKLCVNWEKVKGITKYNVYVATKKGGSFKKVKTVSSKKTSVKLKKIGGKKVKNNKTYYVYVQGIKKVGPNTYTTGLLYITPISKKGTGSVLYANSSWK